MIRIDTHVHCRDGNQAHKETISHVFKVANEQGVKIIFDMPNTDPPIISGEDVEERLKLVPPKQKGNYFLWLGLTSEEEQVKEAVNVYNRRNQVIGLKFFAGGADNCLTIKDPGKQAEIYKILEYMSYKGVLALHCEKEDLFKPKLWDPRNPMSHSKARPKQAEIEAIRDQIRFAIQAGFEGVLHIVHVSCPESVELINQARKNIKITCAATPHHLLFSQEVQQQGRAGLIYKVNPPLRSLQDIEALRNCLLRGEIDWIETDHAPHAIGEKLFEGHLSGFPSLYLYRDLITKFLPSVGASTKLIRKMTYDNIVDVFGEKIGGRKND